MPYKIEKLSLKNMWFATMELTIPDYSRELYIRAVSSLKNELLNKNIELSDPEYNYIIAHDSDDRIELVDVTIFVGVKAPGDDMETIKFVEEKADELIRLTADSFEDVHIGIAEWLHDHDYVADGDMRRVVDIEEEYVFDCPYKVSED